MLNLGFSCNQYFTIIYVFNANIFYCDANLNVIINVTTKIGCIILLPWEINNIQEIQ